MAFADMVSHMDQVLLESFAETVVFSRDAVSLTVRAVVDETEENAEPLITGTARQSLRLTMAAVDAESVTPEWTALVRSHRREVIAVIPDGISLGTVLLGEEV